MNTEKEYATYWYENQDGEIEPIEIDTLTDPPDTISIPTINGVIESFTLLDEGFDDFDTIFDD
tara:strand:+ start:957 stop:1145 length:189 start_codon:yes stop_codon:yes gene_type:complete